MTLNSSNNWEEYYSNRIRINWFHDREWFHEIFEFECLSNVSESHRHDLLTWLLRRHYRLSARLHANDRWSNWRVDDIERDAHVSSSHSLQKIKIRVELLNSQSELDRIWDLHFWWLNHWRVCWMKNSKTITFYSSGHECLIARSYNRQHNRSRKPSIRRPYERTYEYVNFQASEYWNLQTVEYYVLAIWLISRMGLYIYLLADQ